MPENITITIDTEVYDGIMWKDYDDGKWLVEIPELDIMTEGYNKEDAIEMMKDAIEFMIKE